MELTVSNKQSLYLNLGTVNSYKLGVTVNFVNGDLRSASFRLTLDNTDHFFPLPKNLSLLIKELDSIAHDLNGLSIYLESVQNKGEFK